MSTKGRKPQWNVHGCLVGRSTHMVPSLFETRAPPIPHIRFLMDIGNLRTRTFSLCTRNPICVLITPCRDRQQTDSHTSLITLATCSLLFCYSSLDDVRFNNWLLHAISSVPENRKGKLRIIKGIVEQEWANSSE